VRTHAEPNIVTAERQERENAVGIGREPQVRGHRRTVEQRDQEAKEMDDTGPQSVVRRRIDVIVARARARV